MGGGEKMENDLRNFNVRQTVARFLMATFASWAKVFLLIKKGATCLLNNKGCVSNLSWNQYDVKECPKYGIAFWFTCLSMSIKWYDTKDERDNVISDLKKGKQLEIEWDYSANGNPISYIHPKQFYALNTNGSMYVWKSCESNVTV